MKAKDIAFYVLGSLIVLGFFTVIALLIFTEVPSTNNDVLNLALGSLIAAFATVVGYFYGSSAGSQRKTDALINGKKPDAV